MSVLAQDVPVLPELPDLHRPRVNSHTAGRGIGIVAQGLGIIALASYLTVGVSLWFAPLSVLLIGATFLRQRQTAAPARPTRTALAEVPTLYR